MAKKVENSMSLLLFRLDSTAGGHLFFSLHSIIRKNTSSLLRPVSLPRFTPHTGSHSNINSSWHNDEGRL